MDSPGFPSVECLSISFHLSICHGAKFIMAFIIWICCYINKLTPLRCCWVRKSALQCSAHCFYPAYIPFLHTSVQIHDLFYILATFQHINMKGRFSPQSNFGIGQKGLMIVTYPHYWQEQQLFPIHLNITECFDFLFFLVHLDGIMRRKLQYCMKTYQQ